MWHYVPRFGGPGAALVSGAVDGFRLLFPGNKTGNTYFAGIEFASSAGGADVAAGASTKISSGGIWTNPNNAWDGDAATVVENAQHEGAYIGVEFGSQTAVTHVRLRASSARPEGCPTIIVPQFTTDGSVTWQTMPWIFSTTDWTSGEEREFELVQEVITNTRANARAWVASVSLTIGGGVNMELGEFEIADSSGGADIVQTGHAIATRVLNGIASSMQVIVDNTASTLGQYTGTAPLRMGAAFETAQPSPYEMRLSAANPLLNAGDYPEDFDIQWTIDTINWNTTDSYTGVAAWTSGLTRTYTITAP